MIASARTTSRTRATLPILPGLIRKQAAPAQPLRLPGDNGNEYRPQWAPGFPQICRRAVVLSIRTRHPHNIRASLRRGDLRHCRRTSLVRLLVMV